MFACRNFTVTHDTTNYKIASSLLSYCFSIFWHQKSHSHYASVNADGSQYIRMETLLTVGSIIAI